MREIWTGKQVTFQGEHVRLTKAASTPAPPEPPRIVVGTGPSGRMIDRAVDFADELNVYAEEHLLDSARAAIERSGRPVGLSTYLDWSWGAWPEDHEAELARLGDRFDRVFISIGGDDMPGRVRLVAKARRAAAGDQTV